MSQFFKGWRRKIGVATLVVTLVLMGGWVNSLSEIDQFCVAENDRTLHVLYSCPAGIGWTRLHETTGTPLYGMPMDRFHVETFHSTSFNVIYPFDWKDTNWGSQSFGIRTGTVFYDEPPKTRELRISIIQYWLLVVPLTAISAWLLVFSSRNVKRN
jgi:hypothetical protein